MLSTNFIKSLSARSLSSVVKFSLVNVLTNYMYAYQVTELAWYAGENAS